MGSFRRACFRVCSVVRWFTALSVLHEVDSMHERKQMMTELSDDEV